MTIYVHIRQLGRKRGVSAAPLMLGKHPATVRELIAEMVRTCVAAYNDRVRRGEGAVQPMTQEQLESLEAIGKLAFGVNYSEKEADEAAAVTHALQSFEDGVYRVFHGQMELTALDAPLDVQENDEFTLIRLVMLAGSIW
ncbi:MAG: hypothetical protein IJ438_14325 [Clostridia bacterium]|nr:hypothetical protein [Clostridia bacterium]